MDVRDWPAVWLRDNCPCPDGRRSRFGRDRLAELAGPVRTGMVATVAGTFGYVRETNYGRVFDVRVEASPANLASTGLALSPHTDNPYRDPVPTVSQDADLRARLPLIELSANGRIRGVRFNNRSTQALRGPAGELAAFYAAYRRWAALLARPERAVALAREEVAR
jgi:gamma-butyrobetaine dioxygenase